jgi:hypothetical protein
VFTVARAFDGHVLRNVFSGEFNFAVRYGAGQYSMDEFF